MDPNVYVYKLGSLNCIRDTENGLTVRHLVNLANCPVELPHWSDGLASFVLLEDMKQGSLYHDLGNTHGVIQVLQGTVELAATASSGVKNLTAAEGYFLSFASDFPVRIRGVTEGSRALVLAGEHSHSGGIHFDREHVSDIPVTERALGIQLRSVWKHFHLPQGIGYEHVELEGIAPRHFHTQSDAVCYVTAGQGWYGCDADGRKVVTPVSAGDLIYIPHTRYHGFKGKPGFTFESAQRNDISTDYTSETGAEYAYPI